jgi:hypothetical protein
MQTGRRPEVVAASAAGILSEGDHLEPCLSITRCSKDPTVCHCEQEHQALAVAGSKVQGKQRDPPAFTVQAADIGTVPLYF